MCLDKKVIALKATTAGTPGDALQVFNLDTKTKLKAHHMPEPVEYWKWISATQLGLVTATSVYHWDIEVSSTISNCQHKQNCNSSQHCLAGPQLIQPLCGSNCPVPGVHQMRLGCQQKDSRIVLT
eukprot:GHUV01041721.1.p2 GENE.GHUV01041721.1~~GHUV01041721.1.p2  ORF type:complete len:125 (-),score=40.85 GHUV01041721.1:378-752(-)